MTYELAKELKDAGFVIKNPEEKRLRKEFGAKENSILVPTLEELLEAMSDHEVYFFGNGSIEYRAWVNEPDIVVEGKTAIEVAAKLYIELNKKA